MSASPIARQATESRAIPTRKLLITDASQLPGDYSSTPNGTLYSTTPGGTRIVYERAFLMNLRNSPISRTPPKDSIPAGLLKGSPQNCKVFTTIPSAHHPPMHVNTIDETGEQFQMDM